MKPRPFLRFCLVLLVVATNSQTKKALDRENASKEALSGVAARSKASQPAQPRLVESYGKLPLSFEANQGQTDQQVKFLSRGPGYTLFLTGNEAVLALRSGSETSKPK